MVINDNSNGEIEKLISSISITETNDNNVKLLLAKIKNQGTGIQNKTMSLLAEHLEYYGKQDIKQLFNDITKKKGYNGIFEGDEDDEIKHYITIADEVMERFHIITLNLEHFTLSATHKSDIMMVHKNYAYQRDFSEVRKFVSDRCIEYNVDHTSTIRNVFLYIANQTLLDPSKLNYDDKIIVFKNGIFDFEKWKFLKLKEPWKWYFFYEIPHNLELEKGRIYDCPMFKKALVQWIDKKTIKWHRLGGRKVLINDIFEAIGLWMTMNMGFRTDFILYGDPGCGKSQFFNIVIRIIGLMNVSHTSLQRLGKNEFGAEGLEFKLLNYCGDLPFKKIEDTGIYKSISGGDTAVESERKGGAKHNIRPVCKFCFNANKVPRLGNYNDEATYDRFILINFGNRFEELDEDTIKNFWKEIMDDPDEVQGIIHEAIYGFRRLLKRNGFREVLKEDTKHLWNYYSNRYYAFLYDYCEMDAGSRVNRDEFWEQYWNIMGTSDTKNAITVNLRKLGVSAKEGRIKGKGNKAWFYYGIKWKSEFQEEMDNSKKDQEIDVDYILTKKNEIDLDEF